MPLPSRRGGRYLFLKTENESVGTAFGIPGFPTILLVKGTGETATVDPFERDKLLQAIVGAGEPEKTSIIDVDRREEEVGDKVGVGRFIIGVMEMSLSILVIPLLLSQKIHDLSMNRISGISSMPEEYIVQDMVRAIEQNCAQGASPDDIRRVLQNYSRRYGPRLPVTTEVSWLIGGVALSFLIDAFGYVTETHHVNTQLLGNDNVTLKRTLYFGFAYVLSRIFGNASLSNVRFLANTRWESMQRKAIETVRDHAVTGRNLCAPGMLSALAMSESRLPVSVVHHVNDRPIAGPVQEDMWETIALGATAAIATVTLAAAVAEDFFPAAGGPANDPPALAFFGASWRMYLARFGL